MKRTVIELRAMLDALPDDLVLRFEPITGAYMGATHPLAAKEIAFYKEDGSGFALPTDKGAFGVIYIHEDEKQSR